jgi:hypothetical protein
LILTKKKIFCDNIKEKCDDFTPHEFKESVFCCSLSRNNWIAYGKKDDNEVECCIQDVIEVYVESLAQLKDTKGYIGSMQSEQ